MKQSSQHRNPPIRPMQTALSSTVVALMVLTLSSCKSRQPPPAQTAQSANANASAQTSAIASGADTPQAIHIANSNNVSIDGGSGYAHVTYSPTVKMFDHAEISSSLMGISSDGHGFLFQNASQNIKSLTAGQVLMVKGEMAGKVLGVTTDGDKTLVVLDQASVSDIVQQGDIHIDAPVRFHGPKQAAQIQKPPFLDKLMNLIDPPVYAQSGLPGSGADVARQQGTQDAAANVAKSIGSAITDGWTVTKYTFTPGDGQCNFDVVLVKKQDGFVARVAMKGWIGNFNFTSNLSLQNIEATKARGAGANLFGAVKNMQGSIQFDWEIGKETPGVWAVEDRVKLPGGISVSLAPLLEGMPLTLDISSALLIHPALTGGGEYSRGGFSLSWGGAGGGFQSSNAGAVTNGNDGGNINLSYNVTADQNISGVAPNGMVISYCAPRIELRLDILGPFATSVASVGSQIDSIVSKMESVFPASVKNAIAQSPLSKVTASNILSSNADVFVQFIATEGVTHSSSVTPFPCSKQEIKFTGQGGLSAQFFGLTDSAKKTTDLFTKTYTRWDPASDFCKKV